MAPAPLGRLPGRMRSAARAGVARLAEPVTEAVAKDTFTLYRQVEALVGIYATLGVERPLPPMRGWPISPDFGRELANTILDLRPQLVLELGSGVSTLIAGYAVKKNGCGAVVSVDHDAGWLERTERLVKSHGLAEHVTLAHAGLTAVEVNGQRWRWYDPEALPLSAEIDVLVVDGPPVTTGPLARYPALPVLSPHLAQRAVVMVDDAGRPDEREIVSRWMAEVPGFAVEWPEAEKGCAVLTRVAK